MAKGTQRWGKPIKLTTNQQTKTTVKTKGGCSSCNKRNK